jgi:hypothetical protein
MTQTAARRLLTEAAAAATYRTAAQVTTEAQAKADAAAAASIPLAQKGVASGVASLGADGKVLTAQLPPAATTVLLAGKGVDTSRASTVTLAADPELTFAAVPVGTYVLEGMLSAGFGPGNLNLALAGTATATLTYAALGGKNTSGTADLPAWAWNTAVARQAAGTSDLAARITVSGTLKVTVAGTVRLDWSQQSSNATATVLVAGSWLRLSKVA